MSTESDDILRIHRLAREAREAERVPMTPSIESTERRTAGPLVAESIADRHPNAVHQFIISAGGTTVCGVLPNDTQADDARLLAAAYTSYARHFSDPIAAAETDVLGALMAAAAIMRDAMGNPDADGRMRITLGVREVARLTTLLARTTKA